MGNVVLRGIIALRSLVSLVDAFAAVKRKRAGHTNHHGKGQDSLYAKTLNNWVKTVQGQHSQLPGGTVATFFRLFFPEEDVSRKYGLQETRLAGYLSDIYGVSTAKGCRGAYLRAWNADNAVGCLGAEVKKLLESTSSSVSLCWYLHKAEPCLFLSYSAEICRC